MGTETIVVHSDGKVERIPFANNQIDWKAFEEAVCKINKLKDEHNENSGNRRKHRLWEINSAEASVRGNGRENWRAVEDTD